MQLVIDIPEEDRALMGHVSGRPDRGLALLRMGYMVHTYTQSQTQTQTDPAAIQAAVSVLVSSYAETAAQWQTRWEQQQEDTRELHRTIQEKELRIVQLLERPHDNKEVEALRQHCQHMGDQATQWELRWSTLQTQYLHDVQHTQAENISLVKQLHDIHAHVEQQVTLRYELQLQEAKAVAVSQTATLQTQYQHDLQHTQAENLSLVKQLHDIHAQVEQHVTLRYESHLKEAKAAAVSQTAFVHSENERLRAQIAELQSGTAATCLAYLEDKVVKQEQTIALLTSHTRKGQAGENVVRHVVSQTLTAFEVEHKGHESKSCDVWARKDKVLLVFESKLKSIITSADVVKFQRDAAYLHETQCVSGAMFVSLSCLNIPNMGHFHIEVQNQIPLMYVAFADMEQAERELPFFVHTLHTLAQHTLLDRGESSLADVMEKMAPLLDRLQKRKQTVEKMRAQHTQSTAVLTSFLIDLEQELKTMTDVLVGMVGRKALPDPADSSEAKTKPSQCVQPLCKKRKLKGTEYCRVHKI